MSSTESIPLLSKSASPGLNLLFSTLCIIDIFGVFPIIALPRAIVQCGFLGIPLVIIVFVLQIYTAAILGKSWIIATSLDPALSRKNRYPLAAVTEMTLGPRARSWVTILLDLTVFGCGIPNLLVAAQNLQLFGYKVTEWHFNLSFCYWLLIVGVFLCPLMWLGSPRDMKWLASFSAITVALTAILIWWSIIMDDRRLNNISVPSSPTLDKFISGYGMLAFQFDVHPTLMTVQVDMRNPRDINKAVILSFLISGSLFAVTTGLSVWRYEGSTTANVLQAVPGGALICAAILISALQLSFSSVIGHSALFQHLEAAFRVQRSFGWKRCVMRSGIMALGVALGESVPRFDIVMSLIGGTLTGPLVFMLPPLMYARAKALKRQQQQPPKILSSSEAQEEERSDYSKKEAHSRSVHFGFSGSEAPEKRSYVYYERDSSQFGHVDMKTIPAEKEEFNWSDRLVDYFGYFIIFLGLVITISSTYVNIRNTVKYVRFTPPCIVNADIPVSAL